MGEHDFGLRIWEKGVGRRGPWEERKAAREVSRRAMRFDPWDVGRIDIALGASRIRRLARG